MRRHAFRSISTENRCAGHETRNGAFSVTIDRLKVHRHGIVVVLRDAYVKYRQ